MTYDNTQRTPRELFDKVISVKDCFPKVEGKGKHDYQKLMGADGFEYWIWDRGEVQFTAGQEILITDMFYKDWHDSKNRLHKQWHTTNSSTLKHMSKKQKDVTILYTRLDVMDRRQIEMDKKLDNIINLIHDMASRFGGF
jgi:hypothetical protein